MTSPEETAKVLRGGRYGLPPRDELVDYLISGNSTRALRFFVSGIICTGLYVAIVWAGTSTLGIAPLVMNIVGYIGILPINFFLHRNYTFIAKHDAGQIRRFLIIHVFNLITSSAVYLVTEHAHAPVLMGILGACILVPLIQFLALDRWVFRRHVGKSLSKPASTPLTVNIKKTRS